MVIQAKRHQYPAFNNAASRPNKVRAASSSGMAHTFLNYKNGIYRTPTIGPVLACNELIMKKKWLLEIYKKRDFPEKIPSGGAGRSPIEQLMSLLLFFNELKIK